MHNTTETRQLLYIAGDLLGSVASVHHQAADPMAVLGGKADFHMASLDVANWPLAARQS